MAAQKCEKHSRLTADKPTGTFSINGFWAVARDHQQAESPYGLMKEYALNHIRDPHVIEGMFLSYLNHGFLGNSLCAAVAM